MWYYQQGIVDGKGRNAMPKRRELKRRARASLKRHYLLFVVICLLSAFLGSEFQNSLDGIKSGVWSVNYWMYGEKEEEDETLFTHAEKTEWQKKM